MNPKEIQLDMTFLGANNIFIPHISPYTPSNIIQKLHATNFKGKLGVSGENGRKNTREQREYNYESEPTKKNLSNFHLIGL